MHTKQMKHGRDLTVGSIPRHMIAFSLPMLAGSLLQTAYSFVNAIWVGKFLGTKALAAVTVSFPVIFFLIAIAGGLTLATNILVSQHYGAKRFTQVRKVIDSSCVLVYGLGVVFFLLGEILAPWILRIMGTPADVYPLSVSYLRIFLLSLPFAYGLFLARNSLQGIGDSTTPLWFQFGSVVFTAVLDPLLMFGWLGFPKLGLNGTAWATNVAHVGAVVALWIYLNRRKSLVSPSLSVPKFDWQTAKITIRIGVPTAVQQSLVSLGMVFVTSIVNSFGEVATAAFGAASRIDQLAFLPAMTFSLAVSTLAGQNIGAKRLDRIKSIFRWGSVFSGSFTVMASVIALVFSNSLLKIFVNEPQVIELGANYLHIVGAFYVFFAVMFVSNGIINGSGHTLVTTLISLTSLWIVRVPIAYFLSRKLGSVSGVWIATAMSFVISMSLSFAYYLSGRWRRTIARPVVPPSPVEIFAEEVGEA